MGKVEGPLLCPGGELTEHRLGVPRKEEVYEQTDHFHAEILRYFLWHSRRVSIDKKVKDDPPVDGVARHDQPDEVKMNTVDVCERHDFEEGWTQQVATKPFNNSGCNNS